MSTNKSIILLFIFAAISLTILSSTKAQEIPDEYSDPNEAYIDTIDTIENLLDSNQAYKERFDSLSKDGEWVKVKKTDLIRDLENISEEDLDYDYPRTTEVIYVWRPYGIYNGWNPYYNGSWVFTSYGWVWSSYYSWGWGPYNYGRWYCSNYYGWIWFPGIRWAPNWVTWRNCNNYVGWYPTCPRVYWRGSRNQICSNRLFVSVPKNWVFVDKRDFTKKIDKTTVVSAVNNSRLLKKSEKVNTAVYSDPSGPKIKYNGPDVNDISKESGKKIIPEQLTLVKSDDRMYTQVKYNNASSDTEIKSNDLTKQNSNIRTQDESKTINRSKNEGDNKNTQEKRTNSKSTDNGKKNKSKEEPNVVIQDFSGSKNSVKEKKTKEKVKNDTGSKEKSKKNHDSSKNSKKNTGSKRNIR